MKKITIIIGLMITIILIQNGLHKTEKTGVYITGQYHGDRHCWVDLASDYNYMIKKDGKIIRSFNISNRELVIPKIFSDYKKGDWVFDGFKTNHTKDTSITFFGFQIYTNHELQDWEDHKILFGYPEKYDLFTNTNL